MMNKTRIILMLLSIVLCLSLSACGTMEEPLETTAKPETTVTPETTAPEATTTATPETTVPEATKTVTPETTVPEATTAATPETTAPEATTAATPETTVPEATTTATPETIVPEITPESTIPETEPEDTATAMTAAVDAMCREGYLGIEADYMGILSYYGEIDAGHVFVVAYMPDSYYGFSPMKLGDRLFNQFHGPVDGYCLVIYDGESIIRATSVYENGTLSDADVEYIYAMWQEDIKSDEDEAELFERYYASLQPSGGEST